MLVEMFRSVKFQLNELVLTFYVYADLHGYFYT